VRSSGVAPGVLKKLENPKVGVPRIPS